jgi:hypothetical protein
MAGRLVQRKVTSFFTRLDCDCGCRGVSQARARSAGQVKLLLTRCGDASCWTFGCLRCRTQGSMDFDDSRSVT